MNGSRQRLEQFLDRLPGLLALPGDDATRWTNVAICPSFVYLAEAVSLTQGSEVEIGAQNCSSHSEGAYTGEVSAAMLSDIGCRYAIIGHSERRSIYGESDETAADKFGAALAASVIPILCVGETLEERNSGLTDEVVGRQLAAVIDAHGAAAFRRAVLAYEPVWAIGTGHTATPEQAQRVHRSLRETIAKHDSQAAASVSILYGGSVKAANAAQLFAQEDIDGGLVGGASLDVEGFAAICRAAWGH